MIDCSTEMVDLISIVLRIGMMIFCDCHQNSAQVNMFFDNVVRQRKLWIFPVVVLGMN